MVVAIACTTTVCLLTWTDIRTLGSWNALQNLLYITFSRPVWTLGVALLTYLCITDQGGVINTFLSCGVWDPIAKLTYSAYLIHPIIIRCVYCNRTQLIDFSDIMVHACSLCLRHTNVWAVLASGIHCTFPVLMYRITHFCLDPSTPRSSAIPNMQIYNHYISMLCSSWDLPVYRTHSPRCCSYAWKHRLPTWRRLLKVHSC